MIIDSINACVTAINQKKTTLQKKQSADEFQKTLASLSKECQRLGNLLDILNGMKNSHIADSSTLDSELKSELLEAIDRCGEELENGPLSKENVQVFGVRTKQLEKELSAAWKSCSLRYSEGVSGYLGIIQGLSDNPQEIKKLQDEIAKLTTDAPTPDSVQKLSSDVTRAKAIVERFSIKPEVEAFLKKVASKQATVTDLSPNVMTWLKKQGLLMKLRITF